MKAGLKLWHFISGTLSVITLLGGMVWQYAQLTQKVEDMQKQQDNQSQQLSEIRTILMTEVSHPIEGTFAKPMLEEPRK